MNYVFVGAGDGYRLLKKPEHDNSIIHHKNTLKWISLNSTNSYCAPSQTYNFQKTSKTNSNRIIKRYRLRVASQTETEMS